MCYNKRYTYWCALQRIADTLNATTGECLTSSQSCSLLYPARSASTGHMTSHDITHPLTCGSVVSTSPTVCANILQRGSNKNSTKLRGASIVGAFFVKVRLSVWGGVGKQLFLQCNQLRFKSQLHVSTFKQLFITLQIPANYIHRPFMKVITLQIPANYIHRPFMKISTFITLQIPANYIYRPYMKIDNY